MYTDIHEGPARPYPLETRQAMVRRVGVPWVRPQSAKTARPCRPHNLLRRDATVLAQLQRQQLEPPLHPTDELRANNPFFLKELDKFDKLGVTWTYSVPGVAQPNSSMWPACSF